TTSFHQDEINKYIATFCNADACLTGSTTHHISEAFCSSDRPRFDRDDWITLKEIGARRKNKAPSLESKHSSQDEKISGSGNGCSMSHSSMGYGTKLLK
ncbi:hypothetical protein STEG23_033201, partial [Scotinomys teguina]